MAIIGGAGNPTGGGFTGPAQALELLAPDRCYAFSGAVQSAAGGGSFDGKVFDFTTGNYVSVIRLNYGVQAAVNNDVYLRIKLNENVILSLNYTTTGELEGNGNLPWEITLPAYTKFEMDWGIDTVTKNLYAIISGRIYR